MGKKNKGLVGIDIGSTSIKLVELKFSGSTTILKNAELVKLPENVRDLSEEDATELIKETIKGLFSSLGIKNKSVCIAVPSKATIIRKVTIPLMPEQEIEAEIKSKHEHYVASDISDLYIDCIVLGENEELQSMDVLVAAAKKPLVESMSSMLQSIKLIPGVVDIDVFAAQNACEFGYDLDQEALTAIVLVGASTTTVNIVRGDEFLFSRSVGIAGDTFVENIQEALKDKVEDLSISEVDEMHPDEASQAVSDVAETLGIEVQRVFDFFDSTFDEGNISRVYVTGGISHLPGFIPTFSDRLETQAVLIEPFNKIDISQANKEFDEIVEISPYLAVATGLALRSLDND